MDVHPASIPLVTQILAYTSIHAPATLLQEKPPPLLPGGVGSNWLKPINILLTPVTVMFRGGHVTYVGQLLNEIVTVVATGSHPGNQL